ncbi:uncharacterized protein LOC6591847 [Drosophila persimilis]|uniref:uncharacterized protein LOC6591847 n=1 Tax=Drosophila persimilis TaxID=7234 RepID=UPI000F0930F8|nr:uncharacterized protein LOC6591847 [Drosophila persimilis]
MELWDEKKRALRALDYFKFLDNDQIVTACRIGTIKQYEPLETIYYEDKGTITNVQFVLSGECLLLQCLNMTVTLKNGKKIFHLIDESEEGISFMNTMKTPSNTSQLTSKCSLNKNVGDIFDSYNSGIVEQKTNKSLKPVLKKYESHFIDVGKLTFGAIIGLGENMKLRVIMARSRVQCLVLPRSFLLENNQNPGNIWQRRLFYLDCTIPSRESIFSHFLKCREWKKLKYNIIQKDLSSFVSDKSRYDDIPIICRIVEVNEDDSNIQLTK